MLETIPAARLEALAEAAEAYIEESFGQRLNLEPVAPSLPHFLLDRYALWKATLNGRSLALIALRQPRQGVTFEYLKHRELICRGLGTEFALLLLDQVPSAIRRQMVDRKIGFVAPGAQLYVPEALLDLRERVPALAVTHADQISPTTQFMLLAIMQGRDLQDRNLTQLADELKVSIMSISRSLDELEALQLATARQAGRQRRLHMRLGARELWNEVQARLQSPVRKVRVVSGELDRDIAPLAGESALARYTMLSPPRIETRAVLSGSWKRVEADEGLRPATPFDERRLEIETWTYDPRVLARDGAIDRLSLYLTVRENQDERVAQAAEEMLELFKW